MEDDKLLARYARDGSEAAFGQLVARHLTLVYSTCLRDTGSPSQAEDAAQVVFLILARKAKSLRTGPSLAGWLYKAARFVAKDVRRQEARRRLREEAVMHELTQGQEASAPEWDPVEPLLNDALSTLKPGEREAVLLRFIEGNSLAETGAALGLSEDATRMRVSRAVEKMRRYLTSHGAPITGLVLTGFLTSEAARPAPAHAAAITQGTLQALATGPTAGVLLLSKGVYQTMKIIQVKLAALAAVLVLGGTALVPLVHALNPHKSTLQVLATPVPLTENATTKFTLGKDQHAFYSVTLPKGASMIILDSRRADGKEGNIVFSLSFADKNNPSLLNRINGVRIQTDDTMESEDRMVSRQYLKQPTSLDFDIHNQSDQCQYWLTVLPTAPVTDASDLKASPALDVPLFGQIVPGQMTLGESKTGRLEKNGCAYFIIPLKAGHYQSLLSFSTVSGKPTAMNGTLLLSNEVVQPIFETGGSKGADTVYRNLNNLRSADADHAAHQDISKFTLKQDGVFLIKISNQVNLAGDADPVNFTAQILPDGVHSAAPAAVTIAVDFVDVAAADYQKATKVVARGLNDDTLLLDALVRHGAKETRIPKAQTAEGVQVVSHVTTSVPFTITDMGQTQHNFMDLDSFMQATPRLNPDGTITVMLQVQRATLIADGPPPQSATATITKSITFRDGQTLVLGGRETTPKVPTYHLIFVTVHRLEPSHI